MNNYLFAFMLPLFLMFSCKDVSHYKAEDYAIISGTISNYNKETIFLLGKNEQRILKIKKNNTFTDTIKLKNPKKIMLTSKGYMPAFYIYPGSNIQVNFDNNDVYNTVSFSGKGSTISNYFLQRDKLKATVEYDTITNFYQLEPKLFYKKTETLKTRLKQLLNSNNDINNDFKILESRDLDFYVLMILRTYKVLQEEKKSDFKLPEQYEQALSKFSFNNYEDFKFSSDYQMKAFQYYFDKANTLLNSKETLDFETAFLIALKENSNDSIRNRFASRGIQNMYNLKDIDAFYHNFMEISTSTKDRIIVEKSFQKLTKLSKGKPSPSFQKYKNFNGGVTSLQDFAGKYVYLDIWATWCAPCKIQIPFLKKLEKEYHNKNIVFVSISVDNESDREKWQSFIKNNNLDGFQLFAPHSFDSDFMKAYAVKAIPRFILINPEGSIINYSAPRPSEPELKQLFNELDI